MRIDHIRFQIHKGQTKTWPPHTFIATEIWGEGESVLGAMQMIENPSPHHQGQ